MDNIWAHHPQDDSEKSLFLQQGIISNKENKCLWFMLEIGTHYGKHTEYAKVETEDVGTGYLSLEQAQTLRIHQLGRMFQRLVTGGQEH